LSLDVKPFYRTEIVFPASNAGLNMIDEKFKENKLDIFQSVKDGDLKGDPSFRETGVDTPVSLFDHERGRNHYFALLR